MKRQQRLTTRTRRCGGRTHWWRCATPTNAGHVRSEPTKTEVQHEKDPWAAKRRKMVVEEIVAAAAREEKKSRVRKELIRPPTLSWRGSILPDPAASPSMIRMPACDIAILRWMLELLSHVLAQGRHAGPTPGGSRQFSREQLEAGIAVLESLLPGWQVNLEALPALQWCALSWSLIACSSDRMSLRAVFGEQLASHDDDDDDDESGLQRGACLLQG